MAGRGPVPSLCNGARAAGALQSHRPPTLPTRPLCPSCCYSLTSAPYPCAVAGIARGSPTPLMLRFPPRSPPSFSTTSHRQPHPPAPLGHCPDAASSSLGAAGAALLLVVVLPSAATMRAVAGSDGSLELICAHISSSLDRTARRLTRAARPPPRWARDARRPRDMASTVSTEQLGVLGRRMRTVAAVTRRLGPLPLADELPRAFELQSHRARNARRRDGRATPARPLDMASAVSTEQLVGMLGRRMRTSRRRCPSPRAADSPTSCLARSSSTRRPPPRCSPPPTRSSPRVCRALGSGLSRCLLPPLPALRALVVEPIKHPRQRPAEPSPKPRRRGERDR